MTIQEIMSWTDAFSVRAYEAGITRISYRFEQLAGSDTELVPYAGDGHNANERFAHRDIRSSHREYTSVSVRITGEYDAMSGEAYTENIEYSGRDGGFNDYCTDLIRTIIDAASVSGQEYRDPADNYTGNSEDIHEKEESHDEMHSDSHVFTDYSDILNEMESACIFVISDRKHEDFTQFNEFICSERRKVIDIISGSDLLVHHEGQSAEIAVTAAAESNGTVQTVRKVYDSLNLNPDEILKVADEAATEASAMTGAKTIAGGQYPAVISADVMTELMSAYLDGFSLKYVRQGTSKYSGRIDGKAASEGITIREDPNLTGGIGNRLYDDEASPVTARSIIENGVLVNLLGTVSDIDASGIIENAGNGYRETARSGISTGVSNLILEWNNGFARREEENDSCSASDVNAIMSGIKDGVWITACDGIFAGADPVSGDFALTSKGYHIIDGKEAGSIDQITIAGNFYEMLFQVQDAADDYAVRLMSTGTFIAPSVRLNGLIISGGK